MLNRLCFLPDLASRSVVSIAILRVLLWAVVVPCSLLACTPLRYIEVESLNYNQRVQYIILHYTSQDFGESLRLLTESTSYPVSSHYLVPEKEDASYPKRRLRVYRLVEEEQRAWHAGRGFWRGVTDLNSRSIGIEIVNRSGCEGVDFSIALEDPKTHCQFRKYDNEQIELVIRLIWDILQRHPNIQPQDILAHSDIAIDRKLDPGPTFPWRKLYDHGIGAWYDDDTVQRYLEVFENQPIDLLLMQKALAEYGYDVAETGELDRDTRYAIRSFQLHFRPSDISGQPDVESLAIVFALLEKYEPQSLVNVCASSSEVQPASWLLRVCKALSSR